MSRKPHVTRWVAMDARPHRMLLGDPTLPGRARKAPSEIGRLQRLPTYPRGLMTAKAFLKWNFGCREHRGWLPSCSLGFTATPEGPDRSSLMDWVPKSRIDTGVEVEPCKCFAMIHVQELSPKVQWFWPLIP